MRRLVYIDRLADQEAVVNLTKLDATLEQIHSRTAHRVIVAAPLSMAEVAVPRVGRSWLDPIIGLERK
jgi:hypothetical protein